MWVGGIWYIPLEQLHLDKGKVCLIFCQRHHAVCNDTEAHGRRSIWAMIACVVGDLVALIYSLCLQWAPTHSIHWAIGQSISRSNQSISHHLSLNLLVPFSVSYIWLVVGWSAVHWLGHHWLVFQSVTNVIHNLQAQVE